MVGARLTGPMGQSGVHAANLPKGVRWANRLGVQQKASPTRQLSNALFYEKRISVRPFEPYCDNQ